MTALAAAFLLLLAAGIAIKHPVLGVLLLAGFIVVHAIVRTVRRRIKSEGLSILIVRWHAGNAWHGDPLTDAGWKREGKRALTRTGHASRFAHRPKRERIAIRCTTSLLLTATVYGLLYDRGITLLALELGAVAAVCGFGWLVVRAARLRKHRKSRMFPLHSALAPIVRKGLPTNPEKWLAIDRGPEVRWVEITLPDEFAADHNQVKAICAAATARLGMKNPKPKPKFTGAKPVLRLEAVVPPPKKVKLADVQRDIEKAKPDELVLGRGEDGELVKVSLAGDSPHIGVSVGSGGGKSVMAELMAAQAAYWGAVVLVLDFPKLVSLPALRGLPNVAYCDSAALVHSACVWLAHELEDRAYEVKEHTDENGVYHGPYLHRLLVVAEESNALMNRLRHYWNDIRERGDPKRSPAVDALELAFLMGRQLFINVVQFGQMLSVRATTGGEGRENMGIRIMGRATVNNWKMMVPEHDYPGKTVRPGRVHVITDTCRETQVVNISHREARHLAIAGRVTECPPRMPGRSRVLVEAQRPVLEASDAPDLGIVSEQPPLVLEPVLDAVTLKQTIEFGYVEGKLTALQRASTRPGFPDCLRDEHGRPLKRGLAKLYDPEAMAAYGRGQR